MPFPVTSSGSPERARQRPLVACLLPVRNGAEHLDGWLASVVRFADVVVALDDGSTDETRARLEESRLVARVLTNPVRPTYRGWDDAANRSRLLAAADELGPAWIMFLDADERLAPDDAAALRVFVDRADPDDGYLFRVYRMIDDLAHYDRARLWAGRLFAHRPGLRLPTEGLHLQTLPTSIPTSRWRRTTLRIQHLASLTEEDRRARVAKYREADPGRVYQADYANLLAPSTRLRDWWDRSPHLPLVANAPVPDPPAERIDGCPVLSVIVISQNDEDTIERTLRAIVSQECPERFEVILVSSGTDRTARIARERFPSVAVVELDHPALPGEARNAGLRVARGRYVTFPGSHVEIGPGSLEARMRAHRRGYTMVTGTMLNGTPTPAGWAAYFLDNTTALPGRPSQTLEGPPARCSYLREALDEIGGFPENIRAAEDTVVNLELFERGYSACRDRDAVILHHSPCRTVSTLVRHHFTRGRGMGRVLLDDARNGYRFPNRRIVRFALLGVVDRLRRMTRHVRDWGDGLRARYIRSLPLIGLGATCWWLGACYELARSGWSSRARERAARRGTAQLPARSRRR